jgi:uncharacterized protein (TIGR02444 family)
MTGAPQAASPDVAITEAELWNFANSFYGMDGVADACILLQDRLGVDVVLLIFAVFAALRHGLVLDADDIAAADCTILGWRTEVIEPLRRLRRRLKSGPAPAPSATQQLRGRVKELELEAERIELATLAGKLSGFPRLAGLVAAAEATPERVARYFARDNALEAGDVADALLVLARAVRWASDPNSVSHSDFAAGA